MKSEIHILFPHLFSGLGYGAAENALPGIDAIHTIARTFSFSGYYQGYERELLNLLAINVNGVKKIPDEKPEKIVKKTGLKIVKHEEKPKEESDGVTGRFCLVCDVDVSIGFRHLQSVALE